MIEPSIIYLDKHPRPRVLGNHGETVGLVYKILRHIRYTNCRDSLTICPLNVIDIYSLLIHNTVSL